MTEYHTSEITPRCGVLQRKLSVVSKAADAFSSDCHYVVGPKCYFVLFLNFPFLIDTRTVVAWGREGGHGDR